MDLSSLRDRLAQCLRPGARSVPSCRGLHQITLLLADSNDASADSIGKEHGLALLQYFTHAANPDIVRRWAGLLLYQVCLASPATVNLIANAAHGTTGILTGLGNIILSKEEDLKLVAGMIIKTLIQNGIDVARCGPIQMTAAPFPTNGSLNWTSDFQAYLDLLHIARGDPENDSDIFCIVSCAIDGALQLDNTSGEFLMFVQNRLTFMLPSAAGQVRCVDVPYPNLRKLSRQKVHSIPNVTDELRLTLYAKTEDWTYLLDSESRREEEICVHFASSDDASAAFEAIRERSRIESGSTKGRRQRTSSTDLSQGRRLSGLGFWSTSSLDVSGAKAANATTLDEGSQLSTQPAPAKEAQQSHTEVASGPLLESEGQIEKRNLEPRKQQPSHRNRSKSRQSEPDEGTVVNAGHDSRRHSSSQRASSEDYEKLRQPSTHEDAENLLHHVQRHNSVSATNLQKDPEQQTVSEDTSAPTKELPKRKLRSRQRVGGKPPSKSTTTESKLTATRKTLESSTGRLKRKQLVMDASRDESPANSALNPSHDDGDNGSIFDLPESPRKPKSNKSKTRTQNKEPKEISKPATATRIVGSSASKKDKKRASSIAPDRLSKRKKMNAPPDSDASEHEKDLSYSDHHSSRVAAPATAKLYITRAKAAELNTGPVQIQKNGKLDTAQSRERTLSTTREGEMEEPLDGTVQNNQAPKIHGEKQTRGEESVLELAPHLALPEADMLSEAAGTLPDAVGMVKDRQEPRAAMPQTPINAVVVISDQVETSSPYVTSVEPSPKQPLVDESLARKPAVVSFATTGPRNQGVVPLQPTPMRSTPRERSSVMKQKEREAYSKILSEVDDEEEPAMPEQPIFAPIVRKRQASGSLPESKKRKTAKMDNIVVSGTVMNPPSNQNDVTDYLKQLASITALDEPVKTTTKPDASLLNRRRSSARVSSRGSPIPDRIPQHVQHSPLEALQAEATENIDHEATMAVERRPSIRSPNRLEHMDDEFGYTAAVLSSNSKKAPESPFAESTAISGHIDEGTLAQARLSISPSHATRNPFDHQPRKSPGTPFASKIQKQSTSQMVPRLAQPLNLVDEHNKMAPRRSRAGENGRFKNLHHVRNKAAVNLTSKLSSAAFGGNEENTMPNPVSSPPQPATQKQSVHFETASSTGSSSSITDSDRDPDATDSQTEEMEWEASLQPHQRSFVDLLGHISRRLVRHLGASESAIDDVIAEYEKSGLSVVQQLEAKQRDAFDVHGAALLEAARSVSEGYARLGEQVRAQERGVQEADDEAWRAHVAATRRGVRRLEGMLEAAR